MPTKTKIKLTASVDDGCSSDVRVAALMKEFEVPTVFYWPVNWHLLAIENNYEPLKYNDAVKISQEHEVGSHTITHRHLTKIPTAVACLEIAESKFILEEMFNKSVTKFCPPRGYTNDLLSGFTLKMYKSQRLTRGAGLVHVHPNSGANNNLPWREYADQIDVKEIWMHSWELDRFNLWGELRGYLEDLRS